MVLVDSSVWIEAIRRAGRLEVKVGLEGLLDEYAAAWFGPVKLEVLGGARAQERSRLTWAVCSRSKDISRPRPPIRTSCF